MIRRLLFLVSCAVVFAGSGAVAVHAQTAAITGRVTDPQGAVVPNAAVTARSLEAAIERTTQTTSDGVYRFPDLAPSNYSVRVVGTQSFAPTEAKSIHIDVGSVKDVNFSLVLSGVMTTLVVTAQAPLIESTKTDVSTVVNEADVARLPATSPFNVAGVAGVNGNMG